MLAYGIRDRFIGDYRQNKQLSPGKVTHFLYARTDLMLHIVLNKIYHCFLFQFVCDRILMFLVSFRCVFFPQRFSINRTIGIILNLGWVT